MLEETNDVKEAGKESVSMQDVELQETQKNLEKVTVTTNDSEAKDADKKNEWKQVLADKASDIQKTISVVADVAKERIQSSITIASGIANETITKASGIANERFQQSIQVAADKLGLLASKGYVEFSKEEGSNEATIYAGSITKIPFFVPKNQAIAWKVMVKGYDLGFLVKLREQADGGSVEQDLDALWRINADELFVGGRRAVDFDRYIILVFDNSYSKIRSKTYVYQVLTGESAVVALQQAQNTANQNAAAEADAAEKSQGENTSPTRRDLRETSIATVRYVNDGVGNIVSSIVIKAQSAGAVIQAKAMTTVETIGQSEWVAYGAKFAPPALKKYIDPILPPANNTATPGTVTEDGNTEGKATTTAVSSAAEGTSETTPIATTTTATVAPENINSSTIATTTTTNISIPTTTSTTTTSTTPPVAVEPSKSTPTPSVTTTVPSTTNTAIPTATTTTTNDLLDLGN